MKLLPMKPAPPVTRTVFTTKSRVQSAKGKELRAKSEADDWQGSVCTLYFALCFRSWRLDAAMVAEDQPVGARLFAAAGHLDVAADQAFVDAAAGAFDA